MPEPEWVTDKTTKAKHPLIKLHNEIIEFCDYAVPQGRKVEDRRQAIKEITAVAKAHWPECEVYLFGSFATGLSLATSDVDLVLSARA